MARGQATVGAGEPVEEPWALPDGWHWERLGNYISKSDGSITPARYPQAIFQLYSVPSFPTGQPESVKGASVGSSKQEVRNNDVLLCKINPRINRVWKVRDFGTGTLIASTEWIRFASNDCLDPDYLRYFLMRDDVKNYLAANASGVGGSLMRVRPSTVDPIAFPRAPVEAQRCIVARIDKLFVEVEEGEAALARARADLGIWRKALLKAAVTGELTADWRAANPPTETGTDLLTRILAERRARWPADCHKNKKCYVPPIEPDTSGLPDLPAGWTWASLPQLGDFGRGKSKHRPRNDSRLYGGKYPFVQTGIVTASRGRIVSFDQTYSDFGLLQSKLWPSGTLCITIAANIAKTGVLEFEACFPDSVVGLTCHAGVDPHYVEKVLRTLQQGLEDGAPSTAQKNINLDTLERLAFPLPSTNEQAAIVAAFDEAESCADLVTRREMDEDAATLRQSILAAAFRGDLAA